MNQRSFLLTRSSFLLSLLILPSAAGMARPDTAERLLMIAEQMEAPQLRRHLVLHVADEDLADGLVQWPQTREFVTERLGPTALVVAEENVTVLLERLREAAIELVGPCRRVSFSPEP